MHDFTNLHSDSSHSRRQGRLSSTLPLVINKDDVAHATPHHPRHEVAASLVTDSLTADCGGSYRGPLNYLSRYTSQQRIVKVDSTFTPCLVCPNANKRREDNNVVDSTAGAHAAHVNDTNAFHT